MEVPRFPAPPGHVTRSVSLECSSLQAAQQQQHRHHLHHHQGHHQGKSSSRRHQQRPRSTSWLVQPAGGARSRRERRAAGHHRRPANHVQPLPSLSLTLTMTEQLPRLRERCGGVRSMDKGQVIDVGVEDLMKRCAATEAESEAQMATTSQVDLAGLQCQNVAHKRSQAAQTSDAVNFRLRLFPSLRDIASDQPDELKQTSLVFRFVRLLARLALCQFGLAWLLGLWAVLGAGAFYVTEGPRERQQVLELKEMQRHLAVGLATELRQLRAEDKQLEPLWSNKVSQYVQKHEKLLLLAVSSGYGEGGDSGQLWTFPGCFLFAVSVLTTLGFGAPVPRTSAGRTVAVVFAAIGIPLHFLLVINLGLLLAVKLKRYGVTRKYRKQGRDLETIDSMPIPMWVKLAPFVTIGVYYIIGIFCFGVSRHRPASDSLMYPLDFTAAGGLSSISGHVRVLYALFLEGAVVLAAFFVAMLKLSANQSFTNLGLKYGLLIPA